MHTLLRLLALPIGIAALLAVSGCGSGSLGGSGGAPQTLTPAIASVSPAVVTVGAAATTLVVTGTNFESTTQIEVGAVLELTTYTSST